MKRIFYLLMVSSSLCGCKISKAAEEKVAYQSEALLIRRLSEHVYEHTSYLTTSSFGKVPCNGMIVLDKKEALIFDTPTDDKVSLELIGWIGKELDSKIVAVIPTHYHADNLGGLNEFHRQGIPSYAFQKTIDIAKANDLPLPQHGFESFLELKVGNEKVYVEFLGEGHTCDNSIGYFPSEDTMFGGCLIKEERAGKGNLEEANVEAWSETVRKVKLKYPNTKLIIPGHGKVGGQELLTYTIKLFE